MAYDGGYSGSDQQKALAWISDATGKPVAGPMLDTLKSGVVLCELANALQPNVVKRISTSSMPFPQRENIKAFIDAARLLGVPDRDNFDTSDVRLPACLPARLPARLPSAARPPLDRTAET